MRTPQEKKRLSYAKDRRNSYGENSKASRKNIPRAKAQANRSERHAQDQALSAAANVLDTDGLADVENRVRASDPRYWRKAPDMPLGEFLTWKAAMRDELSATDAI